MSDYRELFLTKLEDKKKLLEGYKIKATTIFDAGELYESLNRWYTQKGYDWKEVRYKSVELASGPQQTDVTWECTKKLDDYTSFVVEMVAQIIVTEVEVALPNNVKKKSNKGYVEMKFTANIVKNTKVWEGRHFGHLMGLIYEKILIRKRLEEYEKAMFAEIHLLFNEVRLYLGIK
ncbi:MAG TPA: hypothetical protein HA362_05605 [Nanoarchaeota archaeon]|nr:hypothetical protein [Nanoarchaeota archaeon]